ncbi:MAG: sigma-70 family RNA polymerase sigma factor [Bacteroidia bacterium]
MPKCDAASLLQEITNYSASVSTSVSAYRRLMDCYYSEGVKSLLQKGCPEEDAKDICSDFFLRLWKKYTQEGGWKVRDFDGLFFTSLKRDWFRLARKQNSETDFPPSYDENEEMEDNSEMESMVRKLNRALTNLKKESLICYKILTLFYMEGRKMAEIAIAMDYESADGAKTQKNRCIKRLRGVFVSIRE